VASLPYSEKDPPPEPGGASAGVDDDDRDAGSDTTVASAWFKVGTDTVRLLRDGEQAFPAMLEAIERAQREVLLEMYWVGADPVGERFRDALAARSPGVIRHSVFYAGVVNTAEAAD
jgi:cardiolipin synthase